MSAFDEAETVEQDPAAEFLAKEQEQLGDIGEDLGLAQPSPAEPDYTSQPADDDGKDIYAGMQTLSIKKDQEEPEFMRKWKEEQQKRLSKKDEEESVAMEELKLKAKQELADWYKRYEAQVEKTKSSNREEEGQYEKNEMNHIEPGSEWERVAKHCDFSAKAPGHTKDVSRMRAIMLQLKQNQTVKA